MYPSYPGGGPPPEPQRIEPPPSVQNAVRLMFAGAALEVVALVVAVLTRGSLKSAILKAHLNYTPAQLHTAEVVRTVFLVVGALITIGLWLWMAWANNRGRNWARIVSAVFFGINTLDLIVSFDSVHTVATLIVAVLIWLVGLGALILLFSKQSNPFFHQQPAR